MDFSCFIHFQRFRAITRLLITWSMSSPFLLLSWPIGDFSACIRASCLINFFSHTWWLIFPSLLNDEWLSYFFLMTALLILTMKSSGRGTRIRLVVMRGQLRSRKSRAQRKIWKGWLSTSSCWVRPLSVFIHLLIRSFAPTSFGVFTTFIFASKWKFNNFLIISFFVEKMLWCVDGAMLSRLPTAFLL